MNNIHLSAIYLKLVRYYFAAEILSDYEVTGFVLDSECGDGLGTDVLAKAGLHTLGVDENPHVVNYANEHFTESSRAIFLWKPALSKELKVDAVVSFEAFKDEKFNLPVLVEMARRIFIFSANYIPEGALIPEGTQFFYQTEDGLIYDRMPTKHPPIHLIGVVIKR